MGASTSTIDTELVRMYTHDFFQWILDQDLIPRYTSWIVGFFWSPPVSRQLCTFFTDNLRERERESACVCVCVCVRFREYVVWGGVGEPPFSRPWSTESNAHSHATCPAPHLCTHMYIYMMTVIVQQTDKNKRNIISTNTIMLHIMAWSCSSSFL